MKLGARIPKFTEPAALPASPDASRTRMEFASMVIRRIAGGSTTVAVISEHGRAALVPCNERLFDLIAKDHEIVGVYTTGARVRDVVEDLKATGL